ncbi:pV2 [European wheat striate mosaic virus]|uniref:PV2 n=1 Tax=European wheat striate mosaic virus TaxID=2661631 RepID=A0A5P9K7F5_9VIRU|nr:NS2 [European wheat striate mosaic virus]QFU19934.1 pV2 [European wheat striate mosaic virus]QFU19938.1 pV2 [European wheat striate mosaic virus]QFU19942.1 pV2 [European wheat striate mosaic virus]QFU19944.1 pV2 [European wheat striate mosaic virus]QFU19952.1 pV2 [European wheat striate mosaic virus]
MNQILFDQNPNAPASWRDYRDWLAIHDRKTIPFDRVMAGSLDRMDLFLVANDALWLLMYSDVKNTAMRSLASSLTTLCSSRMVIYIDTGLTPSRVKCWICNKDATSTTEHLKICLLDHVHKGFTGATSSYMIAMKDHCAQNPEHYLSELLVPEGLCVYSKPAQKLEHKHMIMTNGVPTVLGMNIVKTSNISNVQVDKVDKIKADHDAKLAGPSCKN